MLIVGAASFRKRLDLTGAVLTPEAAPAGDIAGVVLRQQGALRRQACHLDGVTHLHGLRQLDEGNVIAGIQSGGLNGREVLAPQPMLRRLGCELRVRPRVTQGSFLNILTDRDVRGQIIHLPGTLG